MYYKAVDTEGEIFHPGCQYPPVTCFQVAAPSDPDVIIYDHVEGCDKLESLLDDPEAHIVFLNAPYDLGGAAAERPSLLPKIFQAYRDDRIYDIAVRQKLMDIAVGDYKFHRKRGYGLKVLAKRLLDIDLSKGEDTWRLRYGELRGVPLEDWPPEAVAYAAGDAEHTMSCFLEQARQLEEDNAEELLDDQHRQCRADFALQLASSWGLMTDPVAVATLKKVSEERQAELQGKMIEAGFLEAYTPGRGKNKGITKITKKQAPVKESMVKAMAALGEPCKLTKKGYEIFKETGERPPDIKYVSIDKEACSDSLDPLLEEYTEYAQLDTFLTGHIKAMEEGTVHPIHTWFEVLLETGRTSSSGPNIQNIRRKKGARECFIPRPGHCFISIDVDRAELHTLAQRCIHLFGRSTLADALNSGFDPHTGLAATLAGTTYEALAARIAAGDPEASVIRDWAKPANFGLPGGMGPVGFRRYAKTQYQIVLSKEQAEGIVEGWKEQWPDIAQDYLGYIRKLCRFGKANVVHFGSNRVRGNVPYCAAANGEFQGMTGDAMKDAMFEISQLCYVWTPGSALFGCRIVNFIHDEFLLEAPLGRASDAAYEARDKLVERYNAWTPDVPVNSTPVLMNRWSKKAKSITAADGTLQVWEYAA